MSATATPIGIAIIEHAGQYLVGIRGSETTLAGLAEFPGGKCLPGEAPSDCAVRECREETGLNVVAVRCLHNQQHDYEHGNVDLHFWLCRTDEPINAAAGHRGFRWISPTELPSLNFPAGNAEVVEMLTAEPTNEG